MRRTLMVLRRVPYVLLLFLLLLPMGILAYTLAAISRTILENWRSGWNDHA